jgi:hypothetical protein
VPLLEFRFDAQQTADYAPVQESALVIVQVEEEILVEAIWGCLVLKLEASISVSQSLTMNGR